MPVDGIHRPLRTLPCCIRASTSSVKHVHAVWHIGRMFCIVCVLAVTLAARLDVVQAMGFDALKAREALEETDCDVDAAIEWLLASCV